MCKIYVLLTKSKTFLSKGISYFSSDQYTHASISFSEDLNPLYSFGRKYYFLPFPGRMVKEDLKGKFYQINNDIPCSLYEIDVDDATYNEAKRIVINMYDRKEYFIYNYLGLFLCEFNIKHEEPNQFFCSEFVSYVLEKANIIELPKTRSLMHPVDIAKNEKLKPVYEGTLDKLLTFIQSTN